MTLDFSSLLLVWWPPTDLIPWSRLQWEWNKEEVVDQFSSSMSRFTWLACLAGFTWAPPGWYFQRATTRQAVSGQRLRRWLKYWSQSIIFTSLSSSSVHLIRQIFSWDQVKLLSCMEMMGARQEEHLYVPKYMMHVWWMNRRWWLLGRRRVIHHSWMDDQLLCQIWSGETVANEKRCTWTMRVINGAFLRHSSSRSHSSTYNNSSSSATYTTVIVTPNCGQQLVLCQAAAEDLLLLSAPGDSEMSLSRRTGEE